MPATDDRWDVTVVGLRDPSHASAVMVVAELAHYASIPPHDVERMLLEEGELPVLANLDRAEAERAAHELNELGAVVDLRLADASDGVFPVLKPDAERQVGVAVGGLIDDSATPPSMGESFGGLPQVEPDLEAPQPSRRSQTGRHRPADMMGAGEDLLGFMADGAARRDDLVSRGPPGLDDEPIPERRPIVRQPSAFSPKRKEKPKAKPGQAPGGQQRQAQGQQRQAQGGHARGGQPKGGQRKPKKSGKPAKQGGGMEDMLGNIASSGRPEDLLGDIGPGPGGMPSESPKLPSRLERATASAAAQTSGPLELDFEAAGMKRPPPRGGPSAAPVHQAERSANSMPRRTRANMGGTGASAAGYSPEQGGFLNAVRADGVAGLLLGLCVGLVLSLVAALALQRGDVRETLPPLEEELTAALSDPTGVESGDVRAPNAIEGELDEALGDIERKFFMVWLGAGLPIGFLLSRLRAL